MTPWGQESNPRLHCQIVGGSTELKRRRILNPEVRKKKVRDKGYIRIGPERKSDGVIEKNTDFMLRKSKSVGRGRGTHKRKINSAV